MRRTDHPHTWLSLGGLAFVALVPWTTALAALHLQAPVAIAVYTANLAVISGLDALAWTYATGRSVLAPGLSAGLTRVSRRLAWVPAVGLTVASGVSWLSRWAGLGIAVVLAFLPLTGASYHLQHRLSRDTTGRGGRGMA